jgi:holo-[acyl-carrier protein] synthase
MIYGIGVDLVHIPRMERVINRWGDRFVKRVFTSDEAEICYKRAHPPAAFALRFAAKEAFSKAIGLGMKKGILWRDVEVFNNPDGKPGVRLHGKSCEISERQRISGIHLSLSDEGDYGVAMVVLERNDEAR